jgi:hypothetical protein
MAVIRRRFQRCGGQGHCRWASQRSTGTVSLHSLRFDDSAPSGGARRLRYVSRPPCQPPSLMRDPFRGDAPVAAGLLTRSQLRGASWRRLYPCVYVAASLPITPSLRIRAAAIWMPADAVITGRSAAQLWGAELADGDDPVEISCPRRIRTTPGVAIRRAQIAGDEIVNRHGVALTMPLHAASEIARTSAAVDAIGWIDTLARRRRLSVADLRTEATRHVGEMGSRQAGSTLGQADPRGESPPESILRLAFHHAGFPVPVPQFSVIINGFFVAESTSPGRNGASPWSMTDSGTAIRASCTGTDPACANSTPRARTSIPSPVRICTTCPDLSHTSARCSTDAAVHSSEGQRRRHPRFVT